MNNRQNYNRCLGELEIKRKQKVLTWEDWFRYKNRIIETFSNREKTEEIINNELLELLKVLKSEIQYFLDFNLNI